MFLFYYHRILFEVGGFGAYWPLPPHGGANVSSALCRRYVLNLLLTQSALCKVRIAQAICQLRV